MERDRIIAGPPRPVSSVTVAELLDVWLAGKQGLSPEGVRACELAKRRVAARWGSVLVGDVQRHAVAEWVATLEARAPDGSMRPASASTKAKTIQALSGALRVGVDWGLIERDPTVGVRAGRVQRRPVVALTVDELGALAGAAGGRDAAAVWLLGTTGPRIGEAARLDVGDVDAGRGRLLVRRSKTGRAREVPIPASVVGMLDLDRARGEPLLLSPRGARLLPNNWARRVLAPAAEAIGRPDVTPHVLRHTAASLAIRAGADAKAVQRMLGHASAAMTLDTYAHLFDAALDDVAVRVEALISGD